MIDTAFMELYEKLSAININESTEMVEDIAQEINLADCRMISSDVFDIRGELEASACLEYNGELTRVQVRTVIIRETENGKEFLGKKYRNRVSLPGGGYDIEKDSGDILNTAEREAYEEFNLTLTNVKDTGIRIWRHRVDPWVAKHVSAEEDCWTGYYSYYVVGEVSGTGNNKQPEEINSWYWLPIEDLGKVNKELANYVTSLNEAIKPDKPGRIDIGDISYLCDSLSTLRKILSRMEIQKTYVPEVRYEIGEYEGNTCKKKQMSLSTSSNLTGHAERRPNRWGFGVILDGKVLSTYYDIEPYSHADHKLPTLHISKIVKLKPNVLSGSRVIIGLGEYGNRIISNRDNADIKLYEILMSFLHENPQYLSTAKTLENSYVSKKDPTKWSNHPFGYETNNDWCDPRFTKLEVDQVEELYAWGAPFSKNAIPIATIKDFNKDAYEELISIFKEYSSFNEEEERIWLENKLVNFVQIPKQALTGIILPDYFKEDFMRSIPENKHLAWLKTFVESNKLHVEWHAFTSPEYYKQEMESNLTDEQEVMWTKVDNITSDPTTILNRAKMNNIRLNKGLITKAKKEQESPTSVVATAAVKLAIKEYMQDLTYENFESKYNTALSAAIAYYEDSGENGHTPKPKKQLQDVFDYYCPERPNAADTNVDNI